MSILPPEMQHYFVKFKYLFIFVAWLLTHLLHLLCLEFEEVQLELDPATLLELDGPGEAAEADPRQVVVQRGALLPRQLVIAGQVPGKQQILVWESWNFALNIAHFLLEDLTNHLQFWS